VIHIDVQALICSPVIFCNTMFNGLCVGMGYLKKISLWVQGPLVGVGAGSIPKNCLVMLRFPAKFSGSHNGWSIEMAVMKNKLLPAKVNKITTCLPCHRSGPACSQRPHTQPTPVLSIVTLLIAQALAASTQPANRPIIAANM